MDGPGQTGGVLSSPALFTHYRANIMGTSGRAYINALVRLKGGAAAIPGFRADLARVTGRSDIDVWDNRVNFGDPTRKVTGYEAACLLAFALAALVAAVFLVGQSVARYVSATVVDLRVLQAVGMTRRQGVAHLAYGALEHRMPYLRRNFRQRFQHETPLVHRRMRNGQRLRVYDRITEQKNIHVNR